MGKKVKGGIDMEIKYVVKDYFDSSLKMMEIEPSDRIEGYLHHIGGWLHFDVQSAGERKLNELEKSIAKGLPEEGEFWGGNSYELTLGKEYSTIQAYNCEDDPTRPPVTLPTEMLLEILKIWIKVCKEDREARKEETK